MENTFILCFSIGKLTDVKHYLSKYVKIYLLSHFPFLLVFIPGREATVLLLTRTHIRVVPQPEMILIPVFIAVSKAAGCYHQQQGVSTAWAYPLSMTGFSEDSDEVAERNLNHLPDVSPVVGAVAVAGMLHRMEDTVTIETNLCLPHINQCRPVHFFGVFYGHGGAHVAIMCRDWMHVMRLECPHTTKFKRG
ncbi:unnamed protein product [Fraxinus pennsylvanica]|uniref:Uncharacterized protein n=1 Tax=Fraxinus pennsylvanica TaxID=56036 RepID=A0AAD1Z410_9LAMI|nr:unnamed protein product [Fraxinus pennsylvanica]